MPRRLRGPYSKLSAFTEAALLLGLRRMQSALLSLVFFDHHSEPIYDFLIGHSLQ